MQGVHYDSEFLERFREQLKLDWRKHPELEWAASECALDGDRLVGAHPKMTATTFCGDELLIDALITGLRVTGGSVRVSLDGKTYVVEGDLAFKRPVFVERFAKIEVVVRGKPNSDIRFSMHGYELPASHVAEAKRAVMEMLEAS